MKNEASTQLYAHGKLLLTGEYAVLDGALALALPVRYGQWLEVYDSGRPGELLWESKNEHGELWFSARFSVPDLNRLVTSDAATAETLQAMLQACRRQNHEFLDSTAGIRVRTRTDFPRQWGLGTSSTLIAALARWAGADPYQVLFETLGGSGYDIACAFAEGPLLYKLTDQKPVVQPVPFSPPFANQLFFVFLGKKQDSREGILRYRTRTSGKSELIEEISARTRQCLTANTLDAFCAVLLEHEQLISRALGLPRAQEQYFPDFPGVIKSLGAWGGDFVLAAGTETPAKIRDYFLDKGYLTCIPYQRMML